MQPYPYPIIAREGWVHVAVALAAAVIVSASAGFAWAWPLWLLLVFVLQFFRDPPRTVPQGADIAVCPADGKVVFLGPARDPYLDRDAFKISIFMDVFSVHANRSPVAGQVRQVWYNKGSFINAALDKASSDNERNALWVKTEQHRDVVFVQVAGLVARRILCYAQTGDALECGQRYGFIRFGSRVDIYLPLGFNAAVQLGDKVKSGSDLLGRFAAA